MGRWEEVAHTADLALHVWGQDLPDLLTAAAQGLMAFVAEPEPESALTHTRIQLDAPDTETLLVDWLGELLYLLERDGTVFTACTFIRITATALDAEVGGQAVKAYREHVKAVTYHNLAVVPTPEGYETEIVFDV